MKIVQLTTDNREHFGDYDTPEPHFGAAPEALLQGFAEMEEAEVHVISCLRKPAASPPLILGNIHYHSLVVPKRGWMTSFYAGCIKATRQLIRELNPDIVHGQGGTGHFNEQPRSYWIEKFRKLRFTHDDAARAEIVKEWRWYPENIFFFRRN